MTARRDRSHPRPSGHIAPLGSPGHTNDSAARGPQVTVIKGAGKHQIRQAFKFDNVFGSFTTQARSPRP